MKKSTLALSIAAAIGGLGLAGNALAITTSLPDAGATASADLVRNDNGIGHQLVFPYFTVQGDNATLLTITNTDTANGKLVKVRFRGAANSDDLYDFQLAMSPGDVWTAALTKDATTGKAQMVTTDKTCTIPLDLKAAPVLFGTTRLDPSATDIANGTREGYVEVLNMADIPNVFASTAQGYTTALFTTIKHASGTAPCSSAVLLDHLYKDMSYTTATDVTGTGTGKGQLANPTTGLTGDWIIMNQKSVAAWSGSATALEVQTSNGTPAKGNLVFWPQQTDDALSLVAPIVISSVTADPLLTSGVVTAQNVDLPDMSTPYARVTTDGTFATAITTAAGQADSTTATLAVKSIANQYVTTAGIAATTDLLMAQPTRRYHVAVNYASTSTTVGVTTTKYPLNTTGTTAVAVYRGTTGTGTTATADLTGISTTTVSGATVKGTAFYNDSNIGFPTGVRNLCLSNISTPAKGTAFDREENTPPAGTTGGFIASPAPVVTAGKVYVCGEAAVLSLNSGITAASSLNASVARSDMSTSTGFNEGWVYFATNGAANTSGLPIIGGSFIRASSATATYGFFYANKVTR